MSIDLSEFLDSGLTLLNLGLTGNPFAGFKKGSYVSVVGDSMTGKSLFLFQVFAEAANDEKFDDYDLLFDNPEDGVHIDITDMYGEKVASRVKPLHEEDGTAVASSTVEEMYSRTRRHVKRGPCIVCVDSNDALSTMAEQKKELEIDDAVDSGKDTKGIMTDGKARANSAGLRSLQTVLKRSGSLFFMISQTRENLGSAFAGKTRSGGKALRFYSQAEIWFTTVKTLKKSVRGKDREIGQLVEIAIKKTRTSSTKWKVTIPLLIDYGFDDVGSCVDWLIENKHWSGGKKIKAPEFSDEPLSRQELLEFIEEKSGRRKKLRRIVGEVWKEIKEALSHKRTKRYA